MLHKILNRMWHDLLMIWKPHWGGKGRRRLCIRLAMITGTKCNLLHAEKDTEGIIAAAIHNSIAARWSGQDLTLSLTSEQQKRSTLPGLGTWFSAWVPVSIPNKVSRAQAPKTTNATEGLAGPACSELCSRMCQQSGRMWSFRLWMQTQVYLLWSDSWCSSLTHGDYVPRGRVMQQ